MPPDLVITLFGDIGYYSAQDCMMQLQCCPNAKSIEVRICSDGGSVFEGLAMYHALKEHPAKITTKCYGLAASMASIVFLAGDERVMYPGSMLMIHNPSGIREPMLGQIRQSMIEIYASNCDLTENAVGKMLDAETYLTAEDALAKGFATSAPSADDEYGREPIAKLQIERIPSAPRALVSLVASAKRALEGRSETVDIKQLNLILGLPENASVEELAAAIEALKGTSVSQEQNVEQAVARLHPKVQAQIEGLRLSAKAALDAQYTAIFASRTDLFTPALEAKARTWPLEVLQEFVANQPAKASLNAEELPAPAAPAPAAKGKTVSADAIRQYAKATGRTIKQVEELYAKKDSLRFPVQFVDSIGAK